MNGEWFAGRLAERGLDPNEVPAKARLYETALATFHGLTGAAPEYVSWTPGRLEVFGTHTDYAGGRTLVCALPRGFVVLGARRDGGPRVSACGPSEARSRRARASGGGAPRALRKAACGPNQAGNWRHYVTVVQERLARNFPGAALGADLVFASDLPIAAGMSSSSAMMVGIARALVALSGIRARPEWRANVTTALDEAGYYACIENGRSFGDLAGDAGVGTHGGSEDHAAMLCAEAGALSAFSFVPMRPLATIGVPEGWRLAVASSGVAAEKTGGALAPYNRLAEGAAVLLDLWNQSHAPAASLAEGLASAPSAAGRLEHLIRTTPVNGWSAEALIARLRHFIREDARVAAAIDAFRTQDPAAIAAVAEASQTDAETLLGNQTPQTIALTRTARASGGFAARSFGAGFGGSVWALANREDAAALLGRWLSSYEASIPGVTAEGFVAHPGPPAVELLTPSADAPFRARR